MARKKRRLPRKLKKLWGRIVGFFAWLGVFALAIVIYIFTAGRIKLDTKVTVEKSTKNRKLAEKARKAKESAEELIRKLNEIESQGE